MDLKLGPRASNAGVTQKDGSRLPLLKATITESCPWPCLSAPRGLAGDSGGLGMNGQGTRGALAGL